MCCINCTCITVYYNIDTRLTYFNMFKHYIFFKQCFKLPWHYKNMLYTKETTFPYLTRDQWISKKLTSQYLEVQPIHLQQCFKLPHPFTRSVYYVIQSQSQNNTWLLGWSLRVCSKFIGWFIDKGPIEPMMSLKWLIGYNCFNPMEASESSQTLDLH